MILLAWHACRDPADVKRKAGRVEPQDGPVSGLSECYRVTTATRMMDLYSYVSKEIQPGIYNLPVQDA